MFLIRRSERLVLDRQKENWKYPDTAVSPHRLQPPDVLLYILQSVQAVDSLLSEVPLPDPECTYTTSEEGIQDTQGVFSSAILSVI